MSNYNVDIKNGELENLINKLEKDNQDILDTVKFINETIRKIDDTKWKSKEKEKLDLELIPYLDLLDNNLANYINAPLNVLKNANRNYIEVDKYQKKEINSLKN